jgi:peptidoglycan-N-acetylmuramic acid deacetylase
MILSNKKIRNNILTALTFSISVTSIPAISLNFSDKATAVNLPETSIGYGQGKETDSANIPLGASNFNSQYAEYLSYATTPQENRIILTFDQGYENGYTAQILDTLKEKDATALFFLTGDYAKSEHTLVQRMIDEGHMIGNHSMNHNSIPTLDYESAKEEIMSLQEYVKEIYNYDMQYFRFPCGEYSQGSLELTNELGLKSIFWSFAYVDWDTENQPDETTAYNTIIESAHSGEILLLHSVSETNAKILGNVIDGLREKGFTV